LIALVSAVIGGAATAKFVSGREIVKTETVEHTVTKDHVVTVIKEVVKADGTKETTTLIDDTSTKKDSTKTNVVDKKAVAAPNWLVSGGAGLEFSGTPGLIYQASVSKRMFGPVFLGAWGTKGRDVAGGISATIEF
jgi:hypothetical protein